MGRPAWAGLPIDAVSAAGVGFRQWIFRMSREAEAGASEIDNQKSNLNSLLNSTDWKGPDADKFRDEWSGTHTTMLTKVADALREAGNKAKRNAEQQEQASN
jgi:uncharacterized protein YukE